MNSVFRRSWLTPLIGAFFLAVGVSGVLMVFHVDFAPMRVMHEWIGLAFVLAAVVHLLLNWRPFVTYCKTRTALVTLAVATVLCAAFMIAGADHEAHHGRHGSGERPHH